MDYNIPQKTNKVLNIIILGLLLIVVRVWYLSVIQHDEQLEKARKPKRRTQLEKIERATIRDRFNIPLALNKIQYNAAVCYADIRQIPAAKWETNAAGKRVRTPVRSNYIKKLSELLARELALDAQNIEDTIHGKASLFPHTPFILKEDLSEEVYYRLKLLEKEWVGIRTERGSRRYYPLGKIGCDVIGYMGAISSKEYYAIAEELKTLQSYLAEREEGGVAVLPKGFNNPLEVRERLKTLQEKAYSINDLVGKTGVEGAFDADLRGYAGKKIYEVDTKGNLIRELPGNRKGVSGQRLLLSISSELQEFAESLLADNEKVREMRHPNGEADLSTPWIKGGAIVALEPNTGEVLALASYPRIDPNDFISSRIPDVRASKQAAVMKWLESEGYIGEIWDGKRSMERERYEESSHSFTTESLELSLERYFEMILAPKSSALTAIQKLSTVGAVLSFQHNVEELLRLSGQSQMSVLIDALYTDDFYRPSKITTTVDNKKSALQQLSLNSAEAALHKRDIDAVLGSIKYNDDKLLVIDLCRMLIDRERIPATLVASLHTLSLSGYRLLNQCASSMRSALKEEAKAWFHTCDFQQWRESHFKEYLKQKRKEEKIKKQYAKPYTDYLEQVEKQMFHQFWDQHRYGLFHALILGSANAESALTPYLEKIAKFKTANAHIERQAEKLKIAIASLDIPLQKAFLNSLRSFDDLNRPLLGRYRALRNAKGVQLEKHLAAAFYPISGYGYGRSQAFRQSTPQGSVFKLVVAYQSLLERFQMFKERQATFLDLNPLTLIDDLQWHPKPGCSEHVVGFTLDGQPIKRFYKGGLLPRSSHPHIGKIDIRGAIEQSSNFYFSILTIDHMADPSNLIQATKLFGFGEKTGIELPGEFVGNLPNDITHNLTGLYAFAIGQHSLIVTPLQTALMMGAIANKGKLLKPKVIQVIAGEEPLREYRDPFTQALYPFKDNLASIGIHFPLFTSTQSEVGTPYIWYSATETRRNLFMPDVIRDPLIEGMHGAIVGAKGTARPHIIRALAKNPTWMRHYQQLKSHFIGKTGTAEILFKQSIDAETEAKIQNHIWTAGIAFAPETPQTWEKPEIVVVVYLRYSEAGGKEAAPLATEIVNKWREICARHGRSAYVVQPLEGL